MDLLYRYGGLNGTERGGICVVDYSLASQERKRHEELFLFENTLSANPISLSRAPLPRFPDEL